MVYFLTKNANFGIFWKAFGLKIWGILCIAIGYFIVYLVYIIMAICVVLRPCWYIFIFACCDKKNLATG
jgi:hypothetical protein